MSDEVKGVSYCESKHRWYAALYTNNTRYLLGYFSTKPQAVRARKAAEKMLAENEEDFEEWYQNFSRYTIGRATHEAIKLPINVINRLRKLPATIQADIADKYYGCREVWN